MLTDTLFKYIELEVQTKGVIVNVKFALALEYKERTQVPIDITVENPEAPIENRTCTIKRIGPIKS